LECFTARPEEVLLMESPKGKASEVPVAELPRYRRGAKGAVVRGGIARIKVKRAAHGEDEAGGVVNEQGGGTPEGGEA
jgi:hypothetical protein